MAHLRYFASNLSLKEAGSEKGMPFAFSIGGGCSTSQLTHYFVFLQEKK